MLAIPSISNTIRLVPTRMNFLGIYLVASIILPHAFSLAIPQVRLHKSSTTSPIKAGQKHGRVALRRFASCYQFRHIPRYPTPTALHNDLRDEIERAAQRRAYEGRAQGGGTGETVGGALLGGLLGGPFGALFGAQIGASFGAASQLDKARKDEMKRKGISPDMLNQATEVGVALNQSIEGLRATQDSVETYQKLAKTLDRQEKSLYDRAKSAIESGDEEGARQLLLERGSVKEKLLKVLRSVAEERKRLAVMERNVDAIETRALEIESLLRRSVGAASLQDSAGIGLSLEPEDPLLKKFRDLGM
mmetsp:Transcript_3519/g.8968  ORF Transcript_3519/g.8968 Transcript_3519/m.8968 type:complete len:305 (-) Transcript_3519:116-1030(-)